MFRRILLAAAVVCVLFGATTLAADMPAVAVHLPDERSIDNAPLCVFKRRGDGWEPLPVVTIERKKDRDHVIRLPPGNYVAEVGASHAGGVTLLRGRFTLPADKSLDLKALRIAARTPIGDVAGDVKQIAARRSGNGEFRWAEVQAGAVNEPDFILSPGEPYLLSACGETDKVLTAIWKTVTPRDDTPLAFADTEAKYELTVETGKTAAMLNDCFVELRFPDAFFRFSKANTGRRFVTNRDRALVGYELKTTTGERLNFSRKGMIFTRKTKLTVGDKPRAELFADGITPEIREDKLVLRTQLFLLDRDGRTLDFGRSSFGYNEVLKLRTKQGREASFDPKAFTGGPFRPGDFLSRSTYRYGGKQSAGVRTAGGWIARSSKHFQLSAPAALTWRAQVFLQSLEQVLAINTRTTGRPPPTDFPVMWRVQDKVALSGIGGNTGSNDNIWLLFPVFMLEGVEPLREPGWGDSPVAVHEMLHSFGFNHSDEMSRLQTLGEAEFAALRWQAVDTGRWAIWAD